MKSFNARARAPLAAAWLAGIAIIPPAFADLPVTAPPPPPLNWQPCVENPTRDCATLTVPRNYADLSKGTVDLFVVRIKAGDPARRVGVLVWNPGGPGLGAGTDLLSDNQTLINSRTFSSELLARFDIVGFDPRGVFEGISCKDGMQEVYWETNFLARSNAELNTRMDLERTVNKNCLDNNQPLVNNLDSASVVRDMEQLRRAAGWTTFNYLGRSYGTFLGYRYARLYPGKLRALLLDAAIDRSVTDQQEQEEAAQGVEAIWTDFKTWCQANTSCRLRGRDIDTEVDALMARARANPLAAERTNDPPYQDLHLTKRPANDWLLSFGIAFLVSNGDIAFAAMEQMLGDAILHNDGSTARLIYDATLGATVGADGSVQYPPDNSTNRAINCVDRIWSQRWQVPTDVRPFVNRLVQVTPRLGESSAFQTTICFMYPIPPVEPPPLDVSLPTQVPTLVVGGTKDSSTPYTWSQRIAQRTGGRLLKRVGYGHTSYDKSRCAQQAMDKFLTALTLPAAGSSCQTDADLFPPAPPLLPPLD